MENREIPLSAPPSSTPVPGVIRCLTEGCNLTANKAYLILCPFILDLFLLFGPKLRIDTILMPVFDSMIIQLRNSAPGTGLQQIEMMQEILEQALSTVNLFGFLQTYPIGVSVLFGSAGSSTPLGTSAEIQVTSLLLIIGLTALFMFFGVLSGTFYFSLTAAAVKGSEGFSWKRFGTQFLNVILLYIALIILIAVLAVPFSCLMTVVYLAIPFLYQILLVLLIMLGCWIMIPLFYIPHGIFVKDLDLPGAAVESFKMATWSSPITIRFILLSLVLSFGLDMIWTIPSQSSWLILVSIFGHSFVTTALLVSSFVLFRELDKWQKENRSYLEWRKANLRIKKIFKKEPESHD